MPAKIGWGFYAGVPAWVTPHLGDAWCVVMDPNARNPFGHANVIGRVPPAPAPGQTGDGWEMAFVRRGAAGGYEYGAYCLPHWQKALWVPLWLGPNEPDANSATDAYNLSEFYQGFATFAHERGFKVVGGVFSRGRPDENILEHYLPLARAVDALAFHEYGYRDLRAPADFGWHAFRYRRFTDMLRAHGIVKDVFITELGLDDDRGGGWRGVASAADFLAQLRWYAHEAAKDPFVKGLVMFAASSYSFFSFLGDAEIARGVAEINASLPAPTPAPKRITAYSQLDPRWRGDALGTAGGKKLADAGCLVTAVASALVDLGCGPHTPGSLNAWLKRNAGFVQGNLFVWGAVRGLGAQLTSYQTCRWTPAPVDAIRKALAAGRMVIAQVDAKPGGDLDQHFVRVLSVDADGRDATIMDPWQAPGAEIGRLSQHYTAPGWDVARALFTVAIYRAV